MALGRGGISRTYATPVTDVSGDTQNARFFVGDCVTDASGNFSVDLSVAEFSQVLGYTAGVAHSAAQATDLTFTAIQEATTDTLTGTVLTGVESTFTAGETVSTLETAPADLDVRVTVIGI